MFSIDNLLDSGNGYYSTYHGEGSVVNEYIIDGVTYVDVEFPKSPGKIYTYIKD